MFEAQEINAEHKDLIHDVAYDFYGQRMATCSSDQYVKVCPSIVLVRYCSCLSYVLVQLFNYFDVKVWDQNSDGKWTLTSSWKAHSGSVWKLTWAHPEFGQVLATCSFDRTAAVWEEIGNILLFIIIY